MTRRFYLTTSIPYVNGEPHLGFALELVQADVLARHRRRRGDAVRFLTGTDDNALKNVSAAEAAGLPVGELVARNAERFAALREPLQLSHDDFIRTSADPRHRPGVERLWRACAESGDLYPREYEGLYCAGCEAFLSPGEASDGRCREHGELTPVAEQNWFFRLSRYQSALVELLATRRLRVEPESRRAEALSFVRRGLEDFSVSRDAARAGGWGIPVPGDPSQVIYVWFDALANYVTSLGYGDGGTPYRVWWAGAEERVHVIGKGILRFHAVWWPAILLSAGEPLPTAILVHDYVSVGGQKLSKSSGHGADPAELVERLGSDSVRWWLLREPRPSRDVDFREDRLVARANAELANGLGNLVNRTVSLTARYGRGRLGGAPDREAASLQAALTSLEDDVDAGLALFDFGAATDAVWRVVAEANRLVTLARPWQLGPGPRRDAIVGLLDAACRRVAAELEPFLPGGAARIGALLEDGQGEGRALFPRL